MTQSLLYFYFMHFVGIVWNLNCASITGNLKIEMFAQDNKHGDQISDRLGVLVLEFCFSNCGFRNVKGDVPTE